MKTCSRCGETKPTTEFYKNPGKRDGFESSCKVCMRIAASSWRAANTEKDKATKTAWAKANPEKMKAYATKWQKANPESTRANTAKWRAANPEKARVATAKWAAANPEKTRAAKTAWCAANPEAVRIHNQNRRARKRDAGGNLSTGLAAKLFKLQRGKCACGCKQSLGDDYHIDHVVPIALGGANEDWNMQLLTATCNLQKHAKHPIEFMQQRWFLL